MAKVGKKRGGGSKPGERRGGRKEGTPNKITSDLRAMILEALSEAGGKTYLVKQAQGSPKAFLSLLGRILPLQMQHSGVVTLEELVAGSLGAASEPDGKKSISQH